AKRSVPTLAVSGGHGAKSAPFPPYATNVSLIANDHQPVIAGLAAPGLTRTAQHLAHAGAALVARERLERFGRGIEALDRIGEPIGRPHSVLVVHIDRMGTGVALRHRPDFPTLGRRIIAADAAGAPEAYPQHA